jgi:23S rRNA (cytosine1962-C5)-methyltransferase
VSELKPELIITPGAAGYRLLDSGHGRKLERFGDVLVDRPEPQALWTPAQPNLWHNRRAVFSASGEDDEKGRWRFDQSAPETWTVPLADSVDVLCRFQGLWHLGLFPEQAPHWAQMLEHIALVKAQGEVPRVLNLFGYTGAASLLGAEVVHVDASKKSVQWGRDNQTASRLDGAPIRWIVDDAATFAGREVRRKRTYHVILLDPPKFGRGPDGEVWDLFRDLPPLLDDVAELIAPSSALVVLTVYAIRASTIAFAQLVRERFAAHTGQVAFGELAVREDGPKARLLPTSHYARWTGKRI